MSVDLYSASGGNDASLQRTTVGGSKPLHRFMKGQPKIVGVIVLAVGVSSFIIALSVNTDIMAQHLWSSISPMLMMGALFFISGILFILAEHNPTKKTVTASLALSIVTILVAIWCVLRIILDMIRIHHFRQFRHYDTTDNDDMEWISYAENMGLCLEAIILFHTSVGIVILITMSSLAGAALRSTKSEAIVVMTTMPTETPVE